jgi:hypothetical protein
LKNFASRTASPARKSNLLIYGITELACKLINVRFLYGTWEWTSRRGRTSGYVSTANESGPTGLVVIPVQDELLAIDDVDRKLNEGFPKLWVV